MQSHHKIFVALLVLFGISFLSVSLPNGVEAGVSDNLSNYAWSDNIGWISFNSTNLGGSFNYGVNVDPACAGSVCNMLGYAWSEHIGWISFNSSDVGGCPGGGNCTPRLDRSDGKVAGWARAYRPINPLGQTLGGWDGWIRLRDDSKNYGVTVTGCQWDGYAWGSDIIGWIHFRNNAKNYGVQGAPGSNACAIVVTTPTPPTTGGGVVGAIPGDYGQFCPSSKLRLSWNYFDLNGDPQAEFRIQIDTNAGFTSPYIDKSVLSLDHYYDTELDALEYGKTYHWRVMARDTTGLWSEWSSKFSFSTPASCGVAVCPIGQSKPYSTCQGGACVSITDSCGVSDCSSCIIGGSKGDVRIKRVGDTNGADSAPSGSVVYLKDPPETTANHAKYKDINSGSYFAYAKRISGKSIKALSIVCPSGAWIDDSDSVFDSKCKINTVLLDDAPSNDDCTPLFCRIRIDVTLNLVTKVVFKYFTPDPSTIKEI